MPEIPADVVERWLATAIGAVVTSGNQPALALSKAARVGPVRPLHSDSFGETQESLALCQTLKLGLTVIPAQSGMTHPKSRSWQGARKSDQRLQGRRMREIIAVAGVVLLAVSCVTAFERLVFVDAYGDLMREKYPAHPAGLIGLNGASSLTRDEIDRNAVRVAQDESFQKFDRNHVEVRSAASKSERPASPDDIRPVTAGYSSFLSRRTRNNGTSTLATR